MSREAHTLSAALDMGLRGRIAGMMDLLGRRLRFRRRVAIGPSAGRLAAWCGWAFFGRSCAAMEVARKGGRQVTSAQLQQQGLPLWEPTV